MKIKSMPEIISLFHGKWYSERATECTALELASQMKVAEIAGRSVQVVKKEAGYSMFVPMTEIEVYWGPEIWAMYSEFALAQK